MAAGHAGSDVDVPPPVPLKNPARREGLSTDQASSGSAAAAVRCNRLGIVIGKPSIRAIPAHSKRELSNREGESNDSG